MASWGQTARVEAPVARPRPRPVSKARAQRRMASGAVWIVLVAALLAGVVALNVAVLQLNLRLDDLSRERVKLRAENAALQSQLSSASASPRIEGIARKAGLVPAPPDATTYIDLARPAK